MLKVDLGQLDREGSVSVQSRISATDELWNDSELRWIGEVDVRLTATLAGTGEVVARGTAAGLLGHACRRCLKPVETPVREDLTMVFVLEPVEDEDDGGTYLFEPSGVDLELGNAVREELILAVNPFVVCTPECRGLCPQCGTDLNEGSCGCTVDEADPRWAALRELKSE